MTRKLDRVSFRKDFRDHYWGHAIGQFLFPVPSSREFIKRSRIFCAHTQGYPIRGNFSKSEKKGHFHSIFLLLHANRDFYIVYHSQCS